MLKKSEIRSLLKKHRAEWIYEVFKGWISINDLKEVVEKEGREVDKLFIENLLNNNLNNKKINISGVRR